jgi:hypothetical protein
MAILALVPYLALSSALSPLIPFIQHDLHMGQQMLAPRRCIVPARRTSGGLAVRAKEGSAQRWST